MKYDSSEVEYILDQLRNGDTRWQLGALASRVLVGLSPAWAKAVNKPFSEIPLGPGGDPMLTRSLDAVELAFRITLPGWQLGVKPIGNFYEVTLRPPINSDKAPVRGSAPTLPAAWLVAIFRTLTS